MKIIFLDIDGVLNSEESVVKNSHLGNYRDLPSDPMINNLNYILDNTNAKIVVSSTWRRLFGKTGMDYLLFLRGVNPDSVIDITPEKMSGYDSRGHEITMWLDEHPEVTHFVILDDVDTMGLVKKHLVLVDPSVGLTGVNAAKAVGMLQDE